ncbi:MULTISPECIES: Nif3-like dinuclear metal center hexameric protein [unclassified Enterococcus]|uniref:Nif3-like dinuclear metal center hexameric protein n=1 Tax=unclassified Enterococcus TaxID=2608891 RepID=UPI0015574C81|nr:MULTISPECIES: Nif3-like dinuclear metal center hexameric protein [unclassified Enterococcus]MBS7576528.1 Nif3-like dinuclear metal center hexameric protein [Enterococcus sp. MMGLQ5-2]MBS7583985.1 Nif3-like dinuclear metal center hexameric protein [Enterococcus sp. MMGLQ5-1]NPD11846.1 Nif3-like dinuclear metal center hexameric protein [Enterococcus sp. MMGLQ5-1]NPD36365.1 Nif3-like dinuclear metal center hexameric protein [Enterococcus sp. MMGLQ5-2]
MKMKAIIEAYEKFCPVDLAMADDPVGLQLGDENADVSKVMVALNIREQTVQEAIDKDIDLIIVKHPLIFSPLKTLVDAHFQEKIILTCIRHQIAVYVSHTNIDIVQGGLNDYFCDKLNIRETEILSETKDGEGIGRIGKIQPVPFHSFVSQVKEKFGLKHLIAIDYDDQSRVIRKVAICGGSGGKFYPEAIAKGADVYLTGDIYYHTAHDMLSQGLLAVDPGHHIEKDFIPLVAEKLGEWQRKYGWSLEIIESKAVTNPFQII